MGGWGGVGGRGREGKTSVKNKLGDISDNNKHILKHRAVDKTTPVCTEGRDWELSELPSSRGGYAARFLIKSRLESAGRHQRGYTRLGVTHDSAARCKLASVWPPGGDPLRQTDESRSVPVCLLERGGGTERRGERLKL